MVVGILVVGWGGGSAGSRRFRRVGIRREMQKAHFCHLSEYFKKQEPKILLHLAFEQTSKTKFMYGLKKTLRLTSVEIVHFFMEVIA